jgi:hypothetical protein
MVDDRASATWLLIQRQCLLLKPMCLGAYEMLHFYYIPWTEPCKYFLFPLIFIRIIILKCKPKISLNPVPAWTGSNKRLPETQTKLTNTSLSPRRVVRCIDVLSSKPLILCTRKKTMFGEKGSNRKRINGIHNSKYYLILFNSLWVDALCFETDASLIWILLELFEFKISFLSSDF